MHHRSPTRILSLRSLSLAARPRVGALLALTCGLLLLAPAGASAKGNLTSRCDGGFTNAAGDGTFEGSLTFERFERRGDHLVALASLDGAFTDGTGKELGDLPEHSVVLAVDRDSLAASCQRVKMTLRPDDAEGAGVRAKLRPVQLEIAATASPQHKLDGPLCDLAKSVGPRADLDVVAQQLDRVLAALE
jgi:hypothetical protein